MPYYIPQSSGELIGPLQIPVVPGHGPVVPTDAIQLDEDLPTPEENHVWVWLEDKAVQLLDVRGKYYKKIDGSEVKHESFGPVPETLTSEPRPSSYHYWSEEDGVWVLDEEEDRKSKIPRIITMRQARLQLHKVGLLTSVDEAIESLPEPPRIAARIEWEYSSTMERNKEFVTLVGGALGLTDDEIDDMFIEAAKL